MRVILFILICFIADSDVYSQGIYKWSPPIFVIDSCLFDDSAKVELVFGDKNARLMLSVNGSNPEVYNEPIFLSETAHLEAFVHGSKLLESDHVRAQAVKNGVSLTNVDRKTKASEKYPESNGELTNRSGADASYADKEWIGYDADSVVYEFRTTGNVTEIGFTFLSDFDAWILPPSEYRIYASFEDGTVSKETVSEIVGVKILPESVQKGMRFFKVDVIKKSVKWRIVVFPAILPKNHPGSGKKAWIFIDELIVN